MPIKKYKCTFSSANEKNAAVRYYVASFSSSDELYTYYVVVNSPRFNVRRTKDTRVSTHYVTAVMRLSRDRTRHVPHK